jgi:hypothetical protein
VDWEKGKKVPALEFANAGTCTLNLPRVELEYHGKKMTLIFNMIIERHQDDRRLVIDSLPFRNGTFVMDLSGVVTRWGQNDSGNSLEESQKPERQEQQRRVSAIRAAIVIAVRHVTP